MGVSAVSTQKAWGSFAFGGSCVAYTNDGGSSWTKVTQVNGKDLEAGLWTISFADPGRPIPWLIGEVGLLVDAGFLNRGQGNALIAKLEMARDRLVDDRTQAGFNAIKAFLNQVDGFVQGGVLSPEQGAELSDRLVKFIDQ